MKHAVSFEQSSDPRRLSTRRSLRADSTMRAYQDGPTDVSVVSLSTTGCAIESEQPIPVGAEISLGVPGAGSCRATVVRRDGTVHGCAFVEPLSEGAVASAFGQSNLVKFPLERLPAPARSQVEPKLPRAVRGWLLIAAAVGGWAVLAALLL